MTKILLWRFKLFTIKSNEYIKCLTTLIQSMLSNDAVSEVAAALHSKMFTNGPFMQFGNICLPGADVISERTGRTVSCVGMAIFQLPHKRS